MWSWMSKKPDSPSSSENKNSYSSSPNSSPRPFLSPDTNSRFGQDIGLNRSPITGLNDIKNSVIKNYARYNNELKKYKEMSKFNAKLSKSYMNNLEIMVDISRVLNKYMETFNVIRDQIEKSEREFAPLNNESLSYLENLTNDKMMELSKNLTSEINKLQSIFNASPDHRVEANKLAVMKNDIYGLSQNARILKQGISNAQTSIGGGSTNKSKSKTKSKKKKH
jgi:membrane-associated HD superfamily phosphohydrolase